jgi:hypothetical protein
MEYFMESALDDKERLKIQRLIDQDKVAPPVIPGKNVPASTATNPYQDQ